MNVCMLQQQIKKSTTYIESDISLLKIDFIVVLQTGQQHNNTKMIEKG